MEWKRSRNPKLFNLGNVILNQISKIDEGAESYTTKALLTNFKDYNMPKRNTVYKTGGKTKRQAINGGDKWQSKQQSN